MPLHKVNLPRLLLFRAGRRNSQPVAGLEFWTTSLSVMPFGNKSSVPTPSARAGKSNSQSGTRRRWNSRLARESRLMLHPRNCNRNASFCCDQPFLVRSLRTCGPMRFNPQFIREMNRRENRAANLCWTQVQSFIEKNLVFRWVVPNVRSHTVIPRD